MSKKGLMAKNVYEYLDISENNRTFAPAKKK